MLAMGWVGARELGWRGSSPLKTTCRGQTLARTAAIDWLKLSSSKASNLRSMSTSRSRYTTRGNLRRQRGWAQGTAQRKAGENSDVVHTCSEAEPKGGASLAL